MRVLLCISFTVFVMQSAKQRIHLLMCCSVTLPLWCTGPVM